MADLDKGFDIAKRFQSLLQEAEEWSNDPSLAPGVLMLVQNAHETLARAFVAVGFSKEQTAAIFPGANAGARPQDGGSGGNKKPPSG